jgi:hypothetical protein
MDERAAAAKKRKREEDGEEDVSDSGEKEAPLVEQHNQTSKAKKRKRDDQDQDTTQPETEEERIQRRKAAKDAKKDRKKERKQKAKDKLERQKARKRGEQIEANSGQNESTPTAKKEQEQKQKKPAKPSQQVDGQSKKSAIEDGDEEIAEEIDLTQQPTNTLTTELEAPDSTSVTSEDLSPDVFSPVHESGLSSTSSIQPTPDDAVDAKLEPALPATDPNQPPAKERLAAAIANFRTQRKADTNSAPKSRAELLEQRRRQEERKKAEKKEQKRREKEEAQRKQEEEIARRFSPGGSGSLLGSPRSPISTPDVESNNFSFGKIAFDDGTSFDPTTNSTSEAAKKKGPADPATALQAALKKKSRVSGLDAEKQERIASQDMWMNARKRAAGEKVKDDTSLLKKALKRHEGQKKKSEKEWKDRKEGIEKSIDAKQKKRQENIAKRRDEKGGKGKGKKVKRPGFEGSFKGRTGGRNNKG